MIALLTLVLVLAPRQAAPPSEGEPRVPGAHWERYADVRAAGFDPERLAAAEARWRALPSSAFLVVTGGAVVAAWGDVERRFMCHSVRKSFLAALYGIYWDRGQIELDKTLADLGLDDEPDPLLESEKRARILDLLRARSGVFHPAAYAGRTDSRPRGSEGPGRFFAYNNWDFNTLAAILAQETGAQVFEAFDEHFARPLAMEDWRTSDGYFHYERDKSRYPAYPFRMSARDAARFGLLFARGGLWGQQRILSEHWVRHCTTMYSIDTASMGYGLMWWVFRDPRLERAGMVAALGVGNQMIAALPKVDMVIVNRADTYRGEGTPSDALTELVAAVLEARTGPPDAAARLVPLEARPPDPALTRVPDARLAALAGQWSVPPPELGGSPSEPVEIAVQDGHLVARFPTAGTFALHLQPGGWLMAEDSHESYAVLHDVAGKTLGLATVDDVLGAALRAGAAGETARAEALLAEVAAIETPAAAVPRALVERVLGRAAEAETHLRAASAVNARAAEARVNVAGYGLLQAGALEAAHAVLALNARVFPSSANVWDSLGEACLRLDRNEEALRHYERALALDGTNTGAREQVARLRAAGARGE